CARLWGELYGSSFAYW
nr:immunoglobulin heavy chain junction region [Mus musculus]MBK4197284.1 immunoglobulin heavy chain junction region [Mus musculus]MBK4197285.1 immunoglobulin heavy chain junction region [Mus musculus]